MYWKNGKVNKKIRRSNDSRQLEPLTYLFHFLFFSSNYLNTSIKYHHEQIPISMSCQMLQTWAHHSISDQVTSSQTVESYDFSISFFSSLTILNPNTPIKYHHKQIPISMSSQMLQTRAPFSSESSYKQHKYWNVTLNSAKGY